jgi:ADP-ribose pyrophosphatase YjhB (NUDIX family)
MVERPPTRYCTTCGGKTSMQLTEQIARPVCDTCGQVHYPGAKVAVAALITQGSGRRERVLLVQRRLPPFQGFWSLPAGFLEPGEDPAAAAAREAREETGLPCQATQLLEALPGEGLVDLLLVYKAEAPDDEPTAADDAQDARWFSIQGLPPLAFPETVITLAARQGRPRPDQSILASGCAGPGAPLPQ